ncbi:uncharacterized protein LOC108592172 [Callithrix jacchus]|uniref:uncharacterized protein LOC108592172 n=1 Tax=Callithrix jacchus TaxID=9483 RepID=UPI0008407A39|nr:uncharacterized protein LOC108592172 [Callithrix jacchus]
MFWFLFSSFFIKCVFLSHHVIWKQFLPTAGFAFTKLVNTANGRPGTMRSSPEEPCPHPLGSRSEADSGSRTSLIKTKGVLPQASHTAFPASEGQRVLRGAGGEDKFSECSADKIDQMHVRLPAARRACACGGPTSAGHQRLLAHGRPLLAPRPPKPVREGESQKSTDWALREDECLPRCAPLRQVSTRMQPERRPGSGRRGPERSGLGALAQPVPAAAGARETALPGFTNQHGLLWADRPRAQCEPEYGAGDAARAPGTPSCLGRSAVL